ncbi:MAG: FAD-dependent oxidoreductase [Thermodesulfobacteriota bacterium]|jgi:2,4-dienoyl-CoA reductase-like NADH-dependent reductase (Old Yellow Enzyme family)/thioredoxin reductase
MNPLPHLFSPIKIKSLELTNRAVMPPMGTNLGNEDGTVSEANLAYIKRRARSGVGLIITEISSVHPNGSGIANELGSYDNRFIPGLKKIVDAVHAGGAKVALQLHHAGRESLFLLQQGKAIAPSAIPSLIFRLTPREMTRDEIQEIIAAFGAAARRGIEAGFDAVEVHGAHGYLLTQFLSSLCNKREDEYGGSLINRSRFIVEVLQEVRKEVGPDFPISLRLSVEECIKDGYTFEYIRPILPNLVKAGADMLHASLGTHGSPGGITSAPPEYPAGFNVWRAKKLKDAVGLPVIAVGRFSDPSLANDVIARGEADLVAFGRQFLADPDFLIKAREGRPEDIRNCIACNQGCIERLILGEGKIRCALNPETGQEMVYPQGPATARRKVWIVGGGPGGLTAAYEAARLGHTVTLFEKEDKTGGQLRFASKSPFKDHYGTWASWLTSQVKKIGVAVRTNTKVTEGMISEGNPEVVILASGGEQIKPDIPGIDLPLVCNAWQVLSGEVPPGKHAVVIGGGLIGMETSDYLCQKGTQVTLVEVLKRSPVLKITSHGYMLHNRLKEAGCRLLFNTTLTKIEESSVTALIEGREQILSPIDQVVIAVGLKSHDGLKDFLQAGKIRHFIIGDALEPRRILEATEEGARAAWNL